MRRAVVKYRLGVLAPMADVPNIAGIIEQIDHAADTATFLMRSHGRILSPGRPDVPVQDETDVYLRMLVVEAYHAYQSTKAEGALERIPPADWEIEGYADDGRNFEITVTGLVDAPRGHLTAEIFFRLS